MTCWLVGRLFRAPYGLLVVRFAGFPARSFFSAAEKRGASERVHRVCGGSVRLWGRLLLSAALRGVMEVRQGLVKWRVAFGRVIGVYFANSSKAVSACFWMLRTEKPVLRERSPDLSRRDQLQKGGKKRSPESAKRSLLAALELSQTPAPSPCYSKSTKRTFAEEIRTSSNSLEHKQIQADTDRRV